MATALMAPEPGNGWVARDLPGGVFCSPRCGCNCTKAGYDRAISEAADMAEKMGSGWEPHVWENGGWNASAQKATARIMQRTEGSKTANEYEVVGYACYINTEKQFIAEAETPQDAFGFAVQDAWTFTRRIEQQLEDLAA